MATEIHPTAVLTPGAELGENVSVGPHTVVGANVKIGDGTRVGPQVVIDGVTTIGRDNVIVGQASLGGTPQDLSYRGEATMLEIGDGNIVREFVTVNRGTIKGGGVTRIGNDCLLMACCHVAHDCLIEDNVILGNNVLLAGHVHVQRRANVSGAAAAHHFVTIGACAYVGGLSRIIQDCPPFMILEGHPSRVRGVNVIGLRRADYSAEHVDDLRQAFRQIFRSGEPRKHVLERLLEASKQDDLVGELVRALQRTEAGSKGRYRESMREQFQAEGERLVPALGPEQ